MRDFLLFALLAPLFLPVSLMAQHGSSGNGYYPEAYGGDTWTGIVSSLAPATREVSLVYTHQDKTDRFVGVLAKNYQLQFNDDKRKKQILATGITVGTRVTVYYMANQTSDNVGKYSRFKAFTLLPNGPDTKQPFNLIFLIGVLAEDGESLTGTVTSTSDSTREITLATDGPTPQNFMGVVVDDYHGTTKDGRSRELVVSQIPIGAKLVIRYFDEVTEPKSMSGRTHRIYQIQLLAPPKAP